MCGPPDFNALMLMGSRLIYFGAIVFGTVIVYKYLSINKARFSNIAPKTKINIVAKRHFFN